VTLRELAAHPGVTGIAYDSRQVKPGAAFFALRGVNADGARFAPQAIAAGALAVVAETAAPAGVAVPWIQVPNARAALAEFAAAFYRNPSDELALVGITGTNGKTTTSYVLASIFESAGIKCGRIGTIGYRVGAREVDAARTTPEAPELQKMLRDMVTEGLGACVMEVSSHALALRRADDLRFAAGIFTNLTRDHLDFHGDMESYFAAKRRLFEILPDGAVGVINVDDRRGAISPPPRGVRSPTRLTPPPTSARVRSPSRSTACRSRCGRLAAPSTCAPRSSGARTPTTSSQLRPPRWRSTCRSRRSRRASAIWKTSPGASRSCRSPPTTSASSSITRTPTTRSRTCSRRRGRWRPDASSPCSAAAAIAIARSAR
jgi:hypothetical protein